MPNVAMYDIWKLTENNVLLSIMVNINAERKRLFITENLCVSFLQTRHKKTNNVALNAGGEKFVMAV